MPNLFPTAITLLADIPEWTGVMSPLPAVILAESDIHSQRRQVKKYGRVEE